MAPKHAIKSNDKPEDELAHKPYEGSHGWEVEPPPLFLVWRTFGAPTASTKIAAFDLDGTIIVNREESRGLYTDPDNWKWFNSTVPGVLKKFHADGYNVLVLSNEDSIGTDLEGDAAFSVTRRAYKALSQMNVPLQAIMATHKNAQRKPNTGMWDFLLNNCNGLVAPDLEKSFFVGDEAGRPGDMGEADKLFAENVGIKFLTPEECFGHADGRAKAPLARVGVKRKVAIVDEADKAAPKTAGSPERLASKLA